MLFNVDEFCGILVPLQVCFKILQMYLVGIPGFILFWQAQNYITTFAKIKNIFYDLLLKKNGIILEIENMIYL